MQNFSEFGRCDAVQRNLYQRSTLLWLQVLRDNLSENLKQITLDRQMICNVSRWFVSFSIPEWRGEQMKIFRSLLCHTGTVRGLCGGARISLRWIRNRERVENKAEKRRKVCHTFFITKTFFDVSEKERTHLLFQIRIGVIMFPELVSITKRRPYAITMDQNSLTMPSTNVSFWAERKSSEYSCLVVSYPEKSQ